MLDTTIKKVIARFEEREILDSSIEELEKFIVSEIRPEFSDDSIIGIKFLACYADSLEDAEETSWFINDVYADKVPELATIHASEDSILDFISIYGFSPNTSYGPKIASEFPPELVILTAEHPDEELFEKYQAFNLYPPVDDFEKLTDVEKYSLFVETSFDQ